MKNQENLKLNIKEVARFRRQRQVKKIVKAPDALAGVPFMLWLWKRVKNKLTRIVNYARYPQS
jgi:hypothetical protein